MEPVELPGLQSALRFPGSRVDEAEDLRQRRIVPPLGLSAVQLVGQGYAASVSTGRWSRTSLQVFDRAQDEVGVRERGPRAGDNGEVTTSLTTNGPTISSSQTR